MVPPWGVSRVATTRPQTMSSPSSNRAAEASAAATIRSTPFSKGPSGKAARSGAHPWRAASSKADSACGSSTSRGGAARSKDDRCVLLPGMASSGRRRPEGPTLGESSTLTRHCETRGPAVVTYPRSPGSSSDLFDRRLQRSMCDPAKYGALNSLSRAQAVTGRRQLAPSGDSPAHLHPFVGNPSRRTWVMLITSPAAFNASSCTSTLPCLVAQAWRTRVHRDSPSRTRWNSNSPSAGALALGNGRRVPSILNRRA